MGTVFDRRRCLLVASAAALAFPGIATAAPRARKRVAVIGHTGRGNYGHGLDTVWLGVADAQIVAVADADADGLQQAQQRLRVDAGFRDYQEMLRRVRPQIVAVCPRHVDQHAAMVLAAIDAGAEGIYVEKPFCRTPAEADQMLTAASRQNVKLAVAHRARYHPTLQAIDQMIARGDIGRPLEMRGRGKGDRRGGGEDLWVLGSHVMNLIHYFGGQPRSCSAVVKTSGRRVQRQDVHQGAEGLGPLAGDEVHARYEMTRGPIAYFDSIANDGTRGAGFGLRIIGSEGLIDIDCDGQPLAHLAPGNPFEVSKAAKPFIPITSAGAGQAEPLDNIGERVNLAPAVDLIAAIDEDRAPLCSGEQGAMTVEMICGVFESHRLGGQAVALPLAQRDHPLTRL